MFVTILISSIETLRPCWRTNCVHEQMLSK